MELSNIEKLLNAYFEGNTTLEEERKIKSYFLKENPPEHLIKFQPMFVAFSKSGNETSKKEFKFSKQQSKSIYKKLMVAASILVLFGISYSLFYNYRTSINEEKMALETYKHTKKAMGLFSKNFNKGVYNLSYLSYLEKGASSMAMLHKFTESKELILK